MFDKLSSGKKVSLLAFAAVAYFMLGVVICAIAKGYDVAAMFSFFTVFAYLVIVLANGIDVKSPRGLARVGAWLFAFLGVVFVLLMGKGSTGLGVVALIMFFFAFVGAGAVFFFDFQKTQKLNLLYCVLAFAFLLLFIFWLVIVAAKPSGNAVYLLTFLLPGLFIAAIAGYNCYQIIAGKE